MILGRNLTANVDADDVMTSAARADKWVKMTSRGRKQPPQRSSLIAQYLMSGTSVVCGMKPFTADADRQRNQDNISRAYFHVADMPSHHATFITCNKHNAHSHTILNYMKWYQSYYLKFITS